RVALRRALHMGRNTSCRPGSADAEIPRDRLPRLSAVLEESHRRRSMYIRTIGAAAVASLIATGAYAQNVNTDADPSAPFSTYRTYAWTTGTPALESLGDQRIRAAVDAQMAAKGFKLATDETPDVYIATHVLTHAEPQLVANGFGPWGFGGFGTI